MNAATMLRHLHLYASALAAACFVATIAFAQEPAAATAPRDPPAAGQAIRRKTRVYELGAANAIVIRGPGGTLRIDASGITISGIAIKLEGPLRLQTGGRGNALGIAGAPNTGLPMDRACAMRADGTCPRKPCPCGKGAA